MRKSKLPPPRKNHERGDMPVEDFLLKKKKYENLAARRLRGKKNNKKRHGKNERVGLKSTRATFYGGRNFPKDYRDGWPIIKKGGNLFEGLNEIFVSGTVGRKVERSPKNGGG